MMIISFAVLLSGVTAYLALRRPLAAPRSIHGIRSKSHQVQYRSYGNSHRKTPPIVPQFTVRSDTTKPDYMTEQLKSMSVSPKQLSLRIEAPFERQGDIFDKSISYAPVDAFTPDLEYPFRVYGEIIQKMKDMEDAGQSQMKTTKWLQKYLYGMTESPSFLASKQHRAMTQLFMAHFKEVLIEGIPPMRGVIVEEMVSSSKDLIIKDISNGIRGLSPSELQTIKSKTLMKKLLESIKQVYSNKIAKINQATFEPLILKDDHEQAAFLQYRLCSVFTQALRRTSEDFKLAPQALLTTEILLMVENRCLQGLATSGMKGDALCPFVQAVTSTVGVLVDITGVLEVKEIEEIFNELSKSYTIHYN